MRRTSFKVFHLFYFCFVKLQSLFYLRLSFFVDNHCRYDENYITQRPKIKAFLAITEVLLVLLMLLLLLFPDLFDLSKVFLTCPLQLFVDVMICCCRLLQCCCCMAACTYEDGYNFVVVEGTIANMLLL